MASSHNTAPKRFALLLALVTPMFVGCGLWREREPVTPGSLEAVSKACMQWEMDKMAASRNASNWDPVTGPKNFKANALQDCMDKHWPEGASVPDLDEPSD